MKVGRISSWAIAAALAAVSTSAHAAPLVFQGDMPSDALDYFSIEFEVPPGTQEIAMSHDDLSAVNTLDFGIDDPSGSRGWGGGTTDVAVLNASAASHGYVPGPITPGTWRVIIGKAKILAKPIHYRVEITLRTEATLAPTPRQRYVPPAPRNSETRYYAGDLHVHSKESTDASASLEENIALAKQRGLEWLEISDHNTVTQLDFFNAAHEAAPDFLLLPGIEVTTYKGHANAIGVTKYVNHRVGLPGITSDTVADDVSAQGGVFSINHPVLELGGTCIGCAWKHDLDPSKLGGVEIGTLGITAGAELFSARAIAFWDEMLDKGSKAAALGGSDDHRAGTATGLFPAKIGSPTTLVRATGLSAAAIVAGIAKGATVVKLDGPDDAMVELEASPETEASSTGEVLAFPGDTVDARAAVLRATVTKGVGQTVRFVKNGIPQDAVSVTSDPFVHSVTVKAPATGQDRWRAEALVENKPRTVTSHIWVRVPEPAKRSDDGCNTTGEGPVAPLVSMIALALTAISLRVRTMRSRNAR